MNETTEQTVAGVLPCPFCGSTEGFYVEEGCTFRWRVLSCRSCGEATEVRHKNNSDEPDSYIADWNAAAPYPAMTLRDYFAAEAIGPLLQQIETYPHENWRMGIAIDAYAMADAMLAARERKPS